MPILSKSFIEGLPPVSKQTDFMDDDVRGFGLRLYPASARYPKGRRVFFVRTYPRGSGKECRTTIGDYGLIALDEARRQARSFIALADTGVMPTHASKANIAEKQNAGMTLAELAQVYEREHLIPHCTPATLRTARSLLNRHLLPRMGRISIEQISKRDVLHHHAEAGKVSKVQANRMMSLLSAMLSWASGHEYRQSVDNPCRKDRRGSAGLRSFEEKKRERFLSPQDVARIEQVLDEAEAARPFTKGFVNPGTCEMIRLLMYTGARFGELARLTWSSVDFERRALRISETKEKRPKAIALNEQAFAVLTRHAERCGFFPTRKGGARGHDLVFNSKNVTRAWISTIRPAAGLDASDGLPAFRIHDFRHSFVSAGVNAGLNLKEIGEAVGHSQMETTGRYAHYTEHRLAKVVDRVGKSLTGGRDE